MNKYAIGMAAAIDFFIPPNVLGRIRTISSRRNFQMSVKDVPRGTANCDVLQEGRKISEPEQRVGALPKSPLLRCLQLFDSLDPDSTRATRPQSSDFDK